MTQFAPPRPRDRRRAAALCALALAALCPACARTGRKPVYPVQGQVLVKGRPAANAQVTFHPVEGGPDAVRPVGQVDEQGRLTLTTYAHGDGAPEGEYRVTVQWFLATRTRGGAEEYQSVNYLPARYARAETSGLRVTVVRGENKLPAIELKTN